MNINFCVSILHSVRKRAGFLSSNRISEMVCDSESEEAGASSYCIIYLRNRILRIFRQPLKYLCFSYSFLDRLRKYVDSIPPRKKIYWKCRRKSVDCNSTQQSLVSLGSCGDAAKMSRVICDCYEEKC